MTTEDGTGLVHIAPAFGEDDFDVAGAAGLIDATDPSTLFNPVARTGPTPIGVVAATRAASSRIRLWPRS